MPWKNGGGETLEIAVHPPAAALTEFEWRISLAQVATDGPFSVFPQTDRTLCVVEGTGLMLHIEGRGPITLTQASDPLMFPADVPASSHLCDGPIRDLNVMTRRGRFRHAVERLELRGLLERPARSGRRFVVCVRGCIDADDGLRLETGDTLVVTAERPLRMQSSGEGALAFLIDIEASVRGEA
jgi:environmental stress-induced protein Ves